MPSLNLSAARTYDLPDVQETERELLGCIMTSAARDYQRWSNWEQYTLTDRDQPKPEKPPQTQLMTDCIRHGLRPDHFSLPLFGKVYSSMWWIYDQIQTSLGGCVLPGAVRICLEETHKKDRDQSKDWIEKMMSGCSHGFLIDAEKYVAEIINAWRQRMVITTAGNIAENAARLEEPEIKAKIIELQNVFAETDAAHTSQTVEFTQEIKHYLQQCEDPANQQSHVLATEFGELNSLIGGGLRPGDLNLIAGRPRSGKTALALRFCIDAAKAGHKTAFFSLEMSIEQIHMRLTSIRSQIPFQTLESRQLSPSQRDKLNWIAEHDQGSNLYCHWLDNPTIGEILTSAQSIRSKYGLDFLVIDQLSKILPDKQAKTERIDMLMGEFTDALQRLALRFDIPVILLAQNSRRTEHRHGSKPRLEDIFNSDRPAQDCATIIGPWRKDFFAMAESNAERKSSPINENAFFCVLKCRNGQEGDVKVIFNGPTMTFCPISEGRDRYENTKPDVLKFELPQLPDGRF